MNKKSIQKLEALYKRIPEIECKGLCHQSCSIVPAEDLEIKRARKKISFNPFRVSNKDVEKTKAKVEIPSFRWALLPYVEEAV